MSAIISKYIASAKILERQGSISPFSFYGQPPDYWSHAFSLACPVDEFSFKDMRTWVSRSLHLIVFAFAVNQSN